jgi:hypothetical protein
MQPIKKLFELFIFYLAIRRMLCKAASINLPYHAFKGVAM